jgi:hypothetical protein
VFVDAISVSAVLYKLISLIAIKMAPQKVRKVDNEGKEGKEAITIEVSTLGKLLVFLVNYAHYIALFIMKRLGKGCLGEVRRALWVFSLFLMEKIVLTYDQLELRPVLANELSS